jgi:hypothetical protein
MKKLSRSLFVLVVFGLIFATCLMPLSAHAAMIEADITILEVGPYNADWYRIIFEYNTTQYTKYLLPETKKELLAVALTALANGGAATARFHDNVIDGGYVYSLYCSP